MSELSTRRCHPLEGGAPMTAVEIERHLALVIDWRCEGGAIEKTFTFADYHHTMAFVNAVAWIAHAEDHHPDLAVGYGRCTVRFHTHSVGGISINDFICAAKVDALLAPGR
jgi:4a-hydroxytetrahydrobiopterin dehydratase